MKNRAAKFFVSILVPLAAGFIGSFSTTPAIPVWYASLAKPSFTPPSWVFGPVWTILYILMGLSLFFVWMNSDPVPAGARRKGVIFFFAQLALNVLWSVIFFGLKNPTFAFLDIVALWICIAFTMRYFYKVSRPAMWLLVPYLMWVTFASYLNFGFMVLYII